MGEGGSDLKGEPSFKQSPPPASSPIHPRRGGADWLGLKDDDLALPDPSPVQKAQQEDSAILTPSLHPTTNPHSAPEPHSVPAELPSATKPATKGARPSTKASQASLKTSEEKDDDWLSHVISQKKSHGLAREERAAPSKGLNSLASSGQTPSNRYGHGLPWLVERIWQGLRGLTCHPLLEILLWTLLPVQLCCPMWTERPGVGDTHALTAVGTGTDWIGQDKTEDVLR